MNRRLFFIYLLLILPYIIHAQCFDKNFCFREGEDVKYEVYYNWGFIWLNAGYVEFKVEPASYNGRSVYWLDAYGASHKSYDWIYKVRDRYQCYLDKDSLRPVWFHRQNYEGGYEVDNVYTFDYARKKVYTATQNSDKPFKRDTLNLPDCVFDVQSLVYYSRNLDFSNLHVGDSIPVKAILDNEFYNLYIRYLGKENITTKDDKVYRCIKFSALLVAGTIFKGGENMFVWVTDDKNRVPVLVEAKILIGSVKAYLYSADGLRNPDLARIK